MAGNTGDAYICPDGIFFPYDSHKMWEWRSGWGFALGHVQDLTGTREHHHLGPAVLGEQGWTRHLCRASPTSGTLERSD